MERLPGAEACTLISAQVLDYSYPFKSTFISEKTCHGGEKNKQKPIRKRGQTAGSYPVCFKVKAESLEEFKGSCSITVVMR